MKSLLCVTFLALAGLAFGLMDCNFDGKMTEDPRCGWSNDLTDDFDWSVTRFPTRTPFTGPSGDHTMGQGNYVYTEASGRSQGQKARLYSPYDAPANGEDNTLTQLNFWYSMWEDFPLPVDPNMGTLNVYIEFTGKVPTGEPIWSRTGAADAEWVEAKIMFRAPEPFRIIFEGVIGPGERSDIGVDDITVIQTEIPTTCDFENSPLGDLCIFMQEDLEDDFDWTRNAGETPSLDTGPLVDHTLGDSTGHYLYIETTRENVAASAIIRSFPYFKYSSDNCELKYYYHAYGADIGTLVIAIEFEETPEAFTSDVIVDGTVTGGEDLWKAGSMSVPEAQGIYTVSFTATRPEGGNLGDIAIDDISLEGDCFDVDYCMSYPCLNGGTCSTSPLGFECACLPGWTSFNCEENINDCTPESCSGNFECIDLVNDFECICPEGFGGENCEPFVTQGVPGPVDSEVGGINPETIPVIVGSCVGAFILIVTAAWFTATCIKQDGYRRRDSDVKDYEAGNQPSMYVNQSFDPDDDIAPVETTKEKADKNYEEISEKPVANAETKEEILEKPTANAVKKEEELEKPSENAEKTESSGAHDNPTYDNFIEPAVEANASDASGKNAAEDGKDDDNEVKKEGEETGEGAGESADPDVPSTVL